MSSRTYKYTLAMRARRKKSGQCWYCAAPVERHGESRCPACKAKSAARESNRVRDRAADQARQKELRHQRKMMGLCMSCETPVERFGTARCLHHQQKERERVRWKHEKMRHLMPSERPHARIG